MHSRRRRIPLMTPVLSFAAMAAIACGSTGSVALASAAHSHKKPAAHRATLTGTWSGRYGGAYHGQFTLHWKQSGSTLSGTIKLSSLGGTLSVNGTVHGSTIRFGTVGSAAITYTGSVSGTSMSGSYATPGGGGSWSAHETS
jgi:hypothetical protein